MFAPAYLDYNATAPLRPEVREAMAPYLGARFGNASSRHEYGRQARAAVDHARAQVAAAVGAHASEVIFTSGGTEANNLFLKGVCGARRTAGILAVSAIEHPCVREPAKQLRRAGWQMRQLAVDPSGCIDPDDYAMGLSERPALVSVMLANNETGVVQDIGRLAAAARAAGVLFHTDAVQALGKIPVSFHGLGVNGMTLSAHKIGGPLGIGALVVDKRVDLVPQIAGGGQERGLRSGTENVPAIVGFGVACELAVAAQRGEAARLIGLRDRITAGVASLGGVVFSQGADRLPNTVFFAFDHVDGETLVGKLDRAGFAVASGSACSSAHPEPSASLMAMGVEQDLARGAVRVSMGWDTVAEHADEFLAALAVTVRDLRQMTACSV
ncbi:MAG: cysteine desulfurase [Zoogloeaceae bacterium]|nr:cysteine desulfurase [Zoogloeaceae bacterium]